MYTEAKLRIALLAIQHKKAAKPEKIENVVNTRSKYIKLV